jgi:hypothetical protein
MNMKDDDVEYTLWRLINDVLSDEAVATVTKIGGRCRLAIVSHVEGAMFEEWYPDVETLTREATDQRIELERQGWADSLETAQND